MTNNTASGLRAMVSRNNVEGIPTLPDSGIHSEPKCGGGGAARGQRRESHDDRRTLVGVAYFFANHSLWKTPIVTFASLDAGVLGGGNTTEWRLAVAGDGWALGIDHDGCPTLFLSVMDDGEIMPEKIGASSKRKATPVKLFGFTFLPKCYDRVRTLVPYFTTKAYTSTFHCASKFQHLCPRGTRAADAQSGSKEGGRSDKTESVLVPTDPDCYIQKDPITKASMRLCGVSFITALSVSDEFAFVKNPIAKATQLKEITTTHPSTCQNFAATCLRKSDNIETTAVSLCDDSYLGKFGKIVKLTDSISVAQTHGANEHVLASSSSADAIVASSNTFCDRGHLYTVNRPDEGKCAQSSRLPCNVSTSLSFCIVSSSVCSNNVPPSNHIPRTPSEGFIKQISEASTSVLNKHTTALSSMNSNLSSLALLSEPVTVVSCGRHISTDKEYQKVTNPAVSTSFLSNIDSRTAQSEGDLIADSSPDQHKQFMRDKRKSGNNPRPYSQTKFPLDIICSGKIEEIKKRDSFFGTSQSDWTTFERSGSSTMYSTVESVADGNVQSTYSISSNNGNSSINYIPTHNNCNQYPNTSGELNTPEVVDDDANDVRKLQNVNEKKAMNSESSDVLSNLLVDLQTKLPQPILPIKHRNEPEHYISNGKTESSQLASGSINYVQPSEPGNLTNAGNEKSTFIFNLRNNSLGNFLNNLAPSDADQASSTKSTDTTAQSDVSLSPADGQNIPRGSHLLRDVGRQLSDNATTTIPVKENSTCNSGEASSLITSDTGICPTTDPLEVVNLSQTLPQSSSTIVRHESDPNETFNAALDEIASPRNAFINSADTLTHSSVMAMRSGLLQQTTTSGEDEEWRDSSSGNMIAAKYTTTPSNPDIDITDDSLDANLFAKQDLTRPTPHYTLNESDTKWLELIEQMVLELFNWSELSDLVTERENRLGLNSTKLRAHSIPDRSSIDETASIVDKTVTATDEDNSCSSNEDNFNKKPFNPAEVDGVCCSFEEESAGTDQLESNSDSFIDAICTSEPSLTDKDEPTHYYDSSEFLDCVPPAIIDEGSDCVPLLEAEFDPNTDEFYSNNFYAATDVPNDCEDTYPCLGEEELDHEPVDINRYLAHSSDVVWGFDRGSLTHRVDQNSRDEWPAVWKPPEYESDQSGYETDEELDNMDEEMMRLEEKLKKFEEELGMSTDESIEEDTNPEEEDGIDDQKYFPLKSSYSTSHLDKAKKLDKRRGRHRKEKDDGTDEHEKTASNDLLFLSGAGFSCGDRRCFSASLVETSTPADRSVVEIAKDTVEELNEPLNTSTLDDDASEKFRFVVKAESPVLENEEYFDEFSLLDTFSEGHLWYEDDVALIDFENLCYIEDKLASNVIFFIFEDELLEEESPGDEELSEPCNISDPEEAGYVVDSEPVWDRQKVIEFNRNSALEHERDQGREMGDSDFYNGIFLQADYLDTLPCVHSSCIEPTYSTEPTGQNQDDDLGGKNHPTEHKGCHRSTNSTIQTYSKVPKEYNRQVSLYEKESNYPIDPGGACEWQKMPTLCNNRSYAIDRSSTVGHGIERASDRHAHHEQSADYSRDNRDKVTYSHDYSDTGPHWRFDESPRPFDYDSNVDAVRSPGHWYDDSILAEVAEDCNHSETTLDSEYPKRPERTKSRRSSNDNADPLREPCDGAITTEMNESTDSLMLPVYRLLLFMILFWSISCFNYVYFCQYR